MSTAFILDVSSFIHRAFHVSKERQVYTKEGVPCGAVKVFRTMLEKLKKDYAPDYLVAALDIHQPTFRTALYPDYKATRATPDPELLAQIPGCRAVLVEYKIPIFEMVGYEADDIIGTLARRISWQGTDVVIVSGDKDMAQLVSVSHDNGIVSILNTNKGVMIGTLDVFEKYGVWPEQMTDYLALVGDTCDNVPGCSGIGPKGAMELIQQFGSIEEMLARPGEIVSGRYRHAVMQYETEIRLSKKLVTIDCNVPLGETK